MSLQVYFHHRNPPSPPISLLTRLVRLYLVQHVEHSPCWHFRLIPSYPHRRWFLSTEGRLCMQWSTHLPMIVALCASTMWYFGAPNISQSSVRIPIRKLVCESQVKHCQSLLTSGLNGRFVFYCNAYPTFPVFYAHSWRHITVGGVFQICDHLITHTLASSLDHFFPSGTWFTCSTPSEPCDEQSPAPQQVDLNASSLSVCPSHHQHHHHQTSIRGIRAQLLQLLHTPDVIACHAIWWRAWNNRSAI